MTARDRIVVMIVAVVVVLGGGWLLVVSPKRDKASKLQGEINTATSQLNSAEAELHEAQAAKQRYASAYASVVALGKAVPPGREVPSLVFQLAQASSERHVDLASIVNSTASGTSTSGGAASSTAQSTALSGFTQMPFQFVFNGNFFDLYHLFQKLNGFTVRSASGGLRVSGRLLTIQTVKLALAPQEHEGSLVPGVAPILSGTVTATAYVLPPSQGLTGGATAAGPAASPASSSGSGATSPTAAAVISAKP
jgi:hypothetical protein